MNACEQLHIALRELEADLKNYKVYGSALITLGDIGNTPEVREIYRTVVGLNCRIPVFANDFDQYKIMETGHAVFVIRLTGMVYIQTVVGKLVLPYGSGVVIDGKF